MKTVAKTMRKKRSLSKKGSSHNKAFYTAYTPLDFSHIQKKGNELSDLIESHFEEIAHVLLEYESYEVVIDETRRSLDLLRNLEENKPYFKLRTGPVSAFLPRNQPLYALCCFVLVPSLMASEVHFRIPNSMKHFFPKLLAILDVYTLFPNVKVSQKQRQDFLRERTALFVNPVTGETRPVTDTVIFTGTPTHADQLRAIFDPRTLFITNGSGHNPIVVSQDANLSDAVEAVLTLQLYNQGQDCAAPNTILVHKDIFNEFRRRLRDELRTVKVGDYRDRKCRVGPISDPKDLVRLQDFLIEHREWLDPTTPGIIRAYDAILEPTIIDKPLKSGGNYSEIFAPVIFLQKYEQDSELALYFEHARYAPNTMYVTLYGTSTYVQHMVGREFNGKVLHDQSSFLHNTHLHVPGAERGVQPYGGNGYGASNISINGKITPKATLPQRDIFEQIAKPLLGLKSFSAFHKSLGKFNKLEEKDLQKLLRLKSQDVSEANSNKTQGSLYVDLQTTNGKRYVHVNGDNSHSLLEVPNFEYAITLSKKEIQMIRELRKVLCRKIAPSAEELHHILYALPKAGITSKTKMRQEQLRFFQNIYQLILGKNAGPRLAQFLFEVDREKVCELIDI